MSEIQNVLIAGAGGNIGPPIVEELSSRGFNVFVLGRPTSSYTPQSSSGSTNVHLLKSDYTPDSLSSIFEKTKFDAVVSTLQVIAPGGADSEAALIKAAAEGGVKRFIPSEFGCDSTNPKVHEFVPFFGGKLAAVALLKKLESKTFTWTALVTGLFFDWGLHSGFLNVDIKNKKLTKFDDGSTLFTVTNTSTIAKAIGNILSDADKLTATANKYIFVKSHTLSLNQLFSAVEKVAGGSWSVEQKDSDEISKAARKALDGGNIYAGYTLIQTSSLGKTGLGGFTGDVANELLGLPKEDLESDIKRILSAV